MQPVDKMEKMTAMLSAPLPSGPVSWLPLPELKPAGLKSASRALPVIAGMLDASPASLITVTLHDGGPRKRTFGLHAWTFGPHGMEITPWKPEGDAAARAKIIGQMMIDLFADLSRRWPKGTAPDVLGVVSDGTGFAFHGRYPSGTDPQWLESHLNGRDPLAQIVPFAEDGAMHRLSHR